MRIKSIQFIVAIISILCTTSSFAASKAGGAKQKAIINLQAQNVSIHNIAKGSGTSFAKGENTGNSLKENTQVIQMKANNVRVINNGQEREFCIGCIKQ